MKMNERINILVISRVSFSLDNCRKKYLKYYFQDNEKGRPKAAPF